MSKSIIALICTWFLIGLVGAFLGGYFWAKKHACAASTTANSQQTNTITPSATAVTTPNSTTPASTTPGTATPTAPASSGTGGTIVAPVQK